MSLRVWLPLTKDLRNQGLSNITVTNNGATFNSAGKLGGCYSFDGSSHQYINTGYKESFGTGSFSLCAWVKITSSSMAYQPIMTNKTTAANSVGCGIYFNHNQKKFLWSTANGSSAQEIWMANELTTMYDVWMHVVMVRDATTPSNSCFYINGIKQPLTSTPSILNVTNTSTNMVIGAMPSDYSIYRWTGSISDVRIYDHCLSPMEVKELSKGLVLHYPLDRGGWGQENLLPCGGTYTQNSPWTTTLNRTDGYASVTNSAFEATPGTTYTISVECDGTLSSTHGSGGLSISDKPWSFWLYICNTDTSKSWQNYAYDTPVCLTNNNYNYRKIGSTHVWTYTLSSTQKYISLRTNSYSDGSTNLTINWWNMKVEEGDTFTGWSPNSSSTLGQSMGLNGTIEYDTSGFCNNGTRISTFSWTSDTPKYQVSTEFPGSTSVYIQIPTITLDWSNVSFSAWGHWDAFNYWSRIFDFGNGANGSDWDICLANYGNNAYPGLGGRTGGGASWPDTQVTEVPLTTGQWYHFVETLEGKTCKLYVNGVLKKTITLTNSLTITTMNRNYLGLSNWSSNGAFKGGISDFRLYATVLSADDVLSLYQNSAYIDSSGNVYGAVHSET